MCSRTDLEAVVAADELDAEYVLVVVELLEPLGAGGRRQAGPDVDLAEAADLELVPDHDAAADERLVPLRLVEAPHQLPHLRSIAASAPARHHTRRKQSRSRRDAPSIGDEHIGNRTRNSRSGRNSRRKLKANRFPQVVRGTFLSTHRSEKRDGTERSLRGGRAP